MGSVTDLTVLINRRGRGVADERGRVSLEAKANGGRKVLKSKKCDVDNSLPLDPAGKRAFNMAHDMAHPAESSGAETFTVE